MCEALRIRLPAAPAAVRVEGAPPLPEEPGGAGDSDREAAFREGYAAATEEWRGRLAEALRRLDEAARNLEAAGRRYWEGLERNTVELGLAVAEKFLISERDRRRYAIPAMVRALLEGVEGTAGPVTVALNPGDLAVLDERAFLDAVAGAAVVKVAADPDLPPAACRIETRSGTVSMSLEERMEELRRLLAEMEVPEDEGGAGD